MPEISTGGNLAIVAHPDDDLLFMNPDIDEGINGGIPHTTIFVTAGDAGLGPDYWAGREIGIKSAYGLMAGIENPDDWIDEVLTVSFDDGRSFDIASSYLESAPDTRVIFMRLPDGGGALSDDEAEQIARLENGTLDSISAVDDSAHYDRQDLVDVLDALTGLHAPSQVMLQVDDGENAVGEHTDHVHVTEFALEALAANDGPEFTITQYVQYQSGGMPENLTAEQAERALLVMETYAEHDPGTWDEDGNLAEVYVNWTGRQYIDDSYSSDSLEELSGGPLVGAGDGPEGTVYALSGPDAFLFTISPATGSISVKDWFVPSTDDALDQDEDFTYEVTRTATAPDGAISHESFAFETVSDGVLGLAEDMGDTGEDSDDAGEDDGDETGEDPGADTGDDPPMDPPEDPPVDPPADPPADPDNDQGDDAENGPGIIYSLIGPDAYLFTIDATTGEIAPQDWFSPSLDDAWDQNEDHIYDVTRVATPEGGDPVHEALHFETVAEGVLSEIDPGEDPGADTGEDGDDSGENGGENGGSDPGDDPNDHPGTVTYSLSGPDAFLFTIDSTSGAISPQDWFSPTLDDAWDQNEDHIFELTRTATPEDGTPATDEAIRLETTADGVLTPLSGDDMPFDDPAQDTADADDSDDGDEGAMRYSLIGPDARLFTIGAESGEIGLQDWFTPDHDDAWDHDEDHIYQITRMGTAEDGGVTVDDLFYQTTAADEFIQLEQADAGQWDSGQADAEDEDLGELL